MSLIVFGVEIPTNLDSLHVFGQDIETLIVYGQKVWEKQKYYWIRYLSNGGTGSMGQQTMQASVSAVLAENKFSKTGYLFKGWGKSAGQDVASYSDGQTVKDIAPSGQTLDLYGLWKAITYYISYQGNGATGGNTGTSTHTYDTPGNLTPNGYARTGYTFQGWSESLGAGVSYGNGASVLNLQQYNGTTMMLYASWLRNPIQVIPDSDDNKSAIAGSTVTLDCTDFRYVKFTIRGQVTDCWQPNIKDWVYISVGFCNPGKSITPLYFSRESEWNKHNFGDLADGQWHEYVMDISDLSGKHDFGAWVHSGPGNEEWYMFCKNVVLTN